MHLTLRALCGPRKLVTLGHCSFGLFSKKGRLKSGRKKVEPLSSSPVFLPYLPSLPTMPPLLTGLSCQLPRLCFAAFRSRGMRTPAAMALVWRRSQKCKALHEALHANLPLPPPRPPPPLL